MWIVFICFRFGGLFVGVEVWFPGVHHAVFACSGVGCAGGCLAAGSLGGVGLEVLFDVVWSECVDPVEVFFDGHGVDGVSAFCFAYVFFEFLGGEEFPCFGVDGFVLYVSCCDWA